MTIDKRFMITAAILGSSGVMLGALGAHALKAVLDSSSLDSFNTGVRYQLYHSLFLIVLAVMHGKLKSKISNIIYYLVSIGTVFFSFSIYLLNLGPVYDLNFRFLGPITPLGGLMLISAWILLAFAVKKD